MSRIESRLGVRLVVRTTRKLHLTPEGETYARAARRILADLDETESTIANQASPRGLVRVSASAAHGRLVIVPLLAEFLSLHPEIKVEVDLDDRLADIIGGRADLAIRFGPLADSPLTARRLGKTARVVVASPEYLARAGRPETPCDLVKQNCLDCSFRRIELGWPFHGGGRDYFLPVTGSMTANSGETLVHLALAGFGIASVADFHIREELTSGRLVPLLQTYTAKESESIHAVFVGGPAMPARLRVLVDFLVKRMSS